jgi:hypothetical protein
VFLTALVLDLTMSLSSVVTVEKLLPVACVSDYVGSAFDNVYQVRFRWASCRKLRTTKILAQSPGMKFFSYPSWV